MRGNYLENQDLEPDIEVHNTQLLFLKVETYNEKAVEVLLQGE